VIGTYRVDNHIVVVVAGVIVTDCGARGPSTEEDGVWFGERSDLALQKVMPDQQAWFVCRLVDLERPDGSPIPLAWVVQLDLERALQFNEHDLVIRDLHQSGWELEVG